MQPQQYHPLKKLSLINYADEADVRDSKNEIPEMKGQ